MKKLRNIVLIIVTLFLFTVYVNATSSYYKNIKVSFNHVGCDDQAEREITIQL